MSAQQPPAQASSPGAGIVSLLTDFGLDDGYVGTMHGVLWSRSRQLRGIVDLTHAVPPQSVELGSFHLAHAWRYFGAGAVHVAVVDPGVGSARRILLARSAGQWFLAPDNGLLDGVLDRDPEVWTVDPERVAVGPTSATFHGRDLFAPAAARIVDGAAPEDLGAPCEDWMRRDVPAPQREESSWRGRVLSVDHFGNLISDVPARALDGDPAAWSARVGERSYPIRRTYAEVAPGSPIALVNSYGLVEIAIRDGDAARQLGVQLGDPFDVLRGA